LCHIHASQLLLAFAVVLFASRVLAEAASSSSSTKGFAALRSYSFQMRIYLQALLIQAFQAF
jgi:hypothetical protein